MAKTLDPATHAEREAAANLQALADPYGYSVRQSLMTGRWRLYDPEKRPVTNHDGTTGLFVRAGGAVLPKKKPRRLSQGSSAPGSKTQTPAVTL